MSETIIRVENLGKKYIIRHQQRESYIALRDVISNKVSSCFKRILHPGREACKSNNSVEEFWALKDVSFEIKGGETVGIIGRNGAGKSTLLKLLSRITEPTTGRIHLKGRVASLLEVGTGFHPELTGRENIFLNGAILGMTREEIKRKFDEIVAFAEVEKFLDTPVKRYSSGMYVRLAFAVAAHLEPEILLVDEVLAVGDAQFQKKCLGKMGDVAKEGRTVLFVSHNMSSIQKLCGRAVLLNKGGIQFEGMSEDVIANYLGRGEGERGEYAFSVNKRKLLANDKCGVNILDIQILSAEGNPCKIIQSNDTVIVRIFYQANDKMAEVPIAFILKAKSFFGQEIFRLSSMPISGYEINRLGHRGHVDVLIESLPFAAGQYYFDVGVARPNIEFLFVIDDVVKFTVSPKDVYGSGVAIDQDRGLIVLNHRWTHYPL